MWQHDWVYDMAKGVEVWETFSIKVKIKNWEPQWLPPLWEEMVVATESLVGRKESMWEIIESGRALILSSVGIDRWEREDDDIAIIKPN
jgi:hypothetical protein